MQAFDRAVWRNGCGMIFETGHLFVPKAALQNVKKTRSPLTLQASIARHALAQSVRRSRISALSAGQ
jgi:hypothetical protein